MSRKDAEAQSENEYAGVPLERDTDLGYKLCDSAPLRDKIFGLLNIHWHKTKIP